MYNDIGSTVLILNAIWWLYQKNIFQFYEIIITDETKNNHKYFDG